LHPAIFRQKVAWGNSNPPPFSLFNRPVHSKCLICHVRGRLFDLLKYGVGSLEWVGRFPFSLLKLIKAFRDLTGSGCCLVERPLVIDRFLEYIALPYKTD